MLPEPGHGRLRGEYGNMRASTADRERVIDVLKAAFAEGRLTQDECEQRVGQALSARTYAELAPITADLPAGPLGTLVPGYQTPPPSRPMNRLGGASPGGERVGRLSPLPLFSLLTARAPIP